MGLNLSLIRFLNACPNTDSSVRVGSKAKKSKIAVLNSSK
jgi:hypothetical protein